MNSNRSRLITTSGANGGRSTVGSPRTTASARGSPPSSPGSPKRTAAPQQQRQNTASNVNTRSASGLPLSKDEDGAGSRRWLGDPNAAESPAMARVKSIGDVKNDPYSPEPSSQQVDERGLFHIIEQLAVAEAALFSILDGLKSNASYVSFFCREYWGTSGSRAQCSLERMECNERLKRQVQQACVLESLSLGVTAHLCSGVMHNVSVTIRSRLRNLLYYVHENCLVLLDFVCQRWAAENPNRHAESERRGHCPENLNLDVLVRVKRYRRLRKGEHIMALRQHNEMIANVVRQLCRGATAKRPPLSSRGAGSPGDRSPGVRSPDNMLSRAGATVLTAVNDILGGRVPLDRVRISTTRSKMLQYMNFKPLLNSDGQDPDCPWPAQDPYERYGTEQFSNNALPIWFEPLPPMYPNLESNCKLPPLPHDNVFTLVLDLDETLVHYYEMDGMGDFNIRPGMREFLQRMNLSGYEVVIFTAATQDYADWVIDQIDPERYIHHRLYRQHALPWGPVFVKDLSRLGRDLDKTMIIDNVQENFMLQPRNGVFIMTWYDDPNDTALFSLTPLLDELITTRAKVPDILEKYQDQIPTWAGFDQNLQLASDYTELDEGPIVDDDMTINSYGLGESPMQHAHVGIGYGHDPQPQTSPGVMAQQQQSQMQQYYTPHETRPPMQDYYRGMADPGLQSDQGPSPAEQLQTGTSVAPSAAYLSGYQQPMSTYLSTRQQGGYPTQQMAPQQKMTAGYDGGQTEQRRAAAPPSDTHARRPPAFSPVSGAYQAAPPQTRDTRGATMYGRSGLTQHYSVQR